MITLEHTIRDVERDPEAAQRLLAYTSIPLIQRLTRPISRVPFGFVASRNDGLQNFFNKFVNFLNGQVESIPPTDPRSVMLWEGEPPCYTGGKKPYIVPFLVDRPAPAVVLAPGGSYMEVCMEWEGEDIAHALNRMGLHAFILNYRVSPDRYPASHLDLIRTVQLIRARAEEWQVRPDRVIVCGFSAGGHLAASMPGLCEELAPRTGDLSHIDARPDALLLGYPLINLRYKIMGQSAGVFLLGQRPERTLYDKLSAQNLADADYPPTYQWAMRNDPFVRVEENCILMRQALQYAQVPNALHLYPGAAHGTGLSAGTGAEDWLREGVDFLLRHLDAGK